MPPRQLLEKTSGPTKHLERAVRSKSTELAGHLDRMARLCASLGRVVRSERRRNPFALQRAAAEHFDPDLLATFESIHEDFDTIFEELRPPVGKGGFLPARAGLPFVFGRGLGLAKIPRPTLQWASLCV
ncbi:MAG: hypothetical protein GY769_25060 [bacterium]|nr:hypothetical protein [bacterium]